jgi:hypothetical protein
MDFKHLEIICSVSGGHLIGRDIMSTSEGWEENYAYL